MMPSRLVTHCLSRSAWAIALAATSICAQDPQRGSLQSLPIAFIRTGQQPAELEFSYYNGGSGGEPEVIPVAPVGTPYAGAPDYRMSQMFPAVDRAWIEIDAISSGNDNIPVDPTNGRVIPQNGAIGWSILSFSVDGATTGGVNTVIADRRSQDPLRFGADIYSWGFGGSTGIDPQYIDKTWLEFSAEEVDWLTPIDELESLDFQAGLLFERAGQTDPVFLPNTNQDFYFSLSRAAVLNAPSTLPAGSAFASVTLDPGAIYRITCSNGIWSTASVVYDRTTLDLPDDANIDAIAVHASDSVIFSTDDVSTEQFLVHVGGQTFRLRDSAGNTLSSLTGLDNTSSTSRNNVDALCGIDPEHGVFSSAIGTPVPDPLDVDEDDTRMSLSVSRYHRAGNVTTPQLLAAVSGWHTSSPQDGEVLLHVFSGVAWNNGLAINGSTQYHGAIHVPRTATQQQVYQLLPLPNVGTGTFAIFAEFIGTNGGHGLSHPSVMEF